jgi:hypothetical protein
MKDAKYFVIQVVTVATGIASKWLRVSLEDRILHILVLRKKF